MPEQGAPARRSNLRGWILPVILLLGALALLRSGVYTVKESEQGVVQTFGKYSKTVEAGLHVKLPWPIQTVTFLPVQRTQKIELGYYQDSQGKYHSEPDESMMITGDMNVVNIDFFVEWKISDPVKFLFVSNDPTMILRDMLMSSVRSVVGMKKIDDTLTTGKVEIQSEVQELLMSKLEANDIGVHIIDVKINDSEPPTEEVARAFRDVETAKQEKDTAINEAEEYRNSLLPRADAVADKLLRKAEAKKETRINEANGLRDRYLSIFSEYDRFPGLTRKRMYLEVIRKTLPEVKVIFDDGSGVQSFLPLKEMTDDETAAVSEAEKGGE